MSQQDHYQEYQLSSKADSYLLEKLNYPRSMSKLIRAIKEITKAQKITYLPDTTNIDTVNNFVCSQNIYIWILRRIGWF